MRVCGLAVVVMMALVPVAAETRTLPITPLPAAPRHGFRAELLTDLADMEKKVLSLAEAVPASRYGWRPATGVRSVSEVYMHMAGANYQLAAAVSAQSAPAVQEGALEQITAKPQVLEELRKSFDSLRRATLTTSDRDLDQTVHLFGNTTTRRGTLMMALNHLHEHLGQSIAYARMNGIVPPWSQQ